MLGHTEFIYYQCPTRLTVSMENTRLWLQEGDTKNAVARQCNARQGSIFYINKQK
jgi:hypothetical protein